LIAPLSSSGDSKSMVSGSSASYLGPRGLFNITSTPLTIVHQVANPTDIIGGPIPSDEPRTKSERSTKVYIGKIPSGLSDYFMEQLFLECGPINSWRRVLDSSGKPLGFGFVEFQTVEGMLRCLRLMNGLSIKNSKLICRVDMQTEFFIKEWSDLKRADWERKRWDNIMEVDPNSAKTWEEDIVKDDEKVSYTIQTSIRNFEQNTDDDPSEREADKEHPREKEREKRIQARNRDRERQFKDKEREWLKREEIKEKERAREREKEEERQREKIKMMRRDMEYESDLEEIVKKKKSSKYAARREERAKQREKEKAEDELNARKEFEMMFPGVATAEEKLKQAQELEERQRPENEHEYTLREHKDLEIHVNSIEESKALPASTATKYFKVDQEDEQDPLFKRNKPLSLPISLEDETPNPKPPQEILMTENDFDKKFQSYKQLLDKVPKRRSELFTFPLAWNSLAQNRILEKRLGPFVSKLFVEYLGQDDRSLVQMVSKMVVNRETPEKILGKIEKFLDVEADAFVKRMWRMLVFEHLKLEVSHAIS